MIALTRARAGDFAGALLTVAMLPQSSTSTRSQVLREVVRLQIESGDAQHALDSIGGFDSPVCEARVLMGMARGLAALKHAEARMDANRLP